MVKNILLACVLTAAGGYLLGSILFGVLISKVMYNDDVRNHGSGNAGMTNVLRTYGKLPAVFTTIGDVGKSVAAVNLGRFIFDALLSGTGAAWQSPLDPVCGAYLPTILFSTICCVIMAAMVIWLHRSNIERLKNGTEYRFGQKK